jgi:hypothetical protein
MEGTGGAFAEKLDGVAAAEAPRAAAAAGADPIGALAAELKSGAITPRQAVDRLVDLALGQGPAASLPAPARAALRAQMEDLLRQDPYLSAKLRRLGVEGEEG